MKNIKFFFSLVVLTIFFGTSYGQVRTEVKIQSIEYDSITKSYFYQVQVNLLNSSSTNLILEPESFKFTFYNDRNKRVKRVFKKSKVMFIPPEDKQYVFLDENEEFKKEHKKLINVFYDCNNLSYEELSQIIFLKLYLDEIGYLESNTQKVLSYNFHSNNSNLEKGTVKVFLTKNHIKYKNDKKKCKRLKVCAEDKL